MYLINDDIEFDEISGALYSLTLKEERKILAPSSRLLKHLIDHQDEVISQKELFKIGWMDKERFVTNNAFYQNILLIRKAFKELGCNYDVITTVPKKGYMLNENVTYKKIILEPVDLGDKIKDIVSLTQEKKDIKVNTKEKIKTKKIYLFLFLFLMLFFFCIFHFTL
ncbi:TPA: winged helix-turn-helix domain-containing protein [Providencia stuartii]|nr:winged helix-turn-helix domain-containing protein [Providencia stuartii]